MLLLFKRFLLFSGTLLWLVMAVARAETGWIEAIRFVGNDKTKPSILLQELTVQVGDPADPANIERSRQAIMDLGLFDAVAAHLLVGQQGQILEFTLSEKYYLIPLPRLDRTADGEVSYGGRLTVDNMGGLNQRFRVTYKALRGCCSTDRTVHSISSSYNYPRVAGTHYGLGVSLAHTVSPVATVDSDGNQLAEHDRQDNKVAIGLSRWLSKEGPSSGWSAGGTLFWRQRQFEQQFGVPIGYGAEKAVGLTLGLGYSGVHDYLFSRAGLQYGVVSEHGLTVMGADTGYSRNYVYYRHYFLRGHVSEHKNLNLQLRFGGTSGTVPIDDYSYGLGGSRDLRGYDKNGIGGRSFFVVNLEYLAPMWGHNAARWVVFADVGNAYVDNRMLDPGDLESSAGFGFRYKIKSFVNFQLRIDASYAVGLKRHKVYFGSKNTF